MRVVAGGLSVGVLRMGRVVVLVDGKSAVVLLLSSGSSSYSSRLGLGLLLAMSQSLVILLGSGVLPRRLIMLGVLLLVRIKMLCLEHDGCMGVSDQVRFNLRPNGSESLTAGRGNGDTRGW